MTDKVNHVRLRWAGGIHRFQLDWTYCQPHAALPDLRRDDGRQMHDRERAVLGRLVADLYGVDDVAVTIRAGLLGGSNLGVSQFDRSRVAEDIVREHVLRRPLGESVALAQVILVAAIYGLPPELADAGLEAGAVAKAALEALAADKVEKAA